MPVLTIVFADLTGSTGLFEALGNSLAAEVVTRTTHWMGEVCEGRGGRVIKYLGDGVLMSFDYNPAAVMAVIDMQRQLQEHGASEPSAPRMKVKIGMARGDIVEQDGDCFGDAVNVAARLSDLSGADQIFATASVVDALPHDVEIRYRNLGTMDIRGKSGPSIVYRIEWQQDLSTDLMTMQSGLDTVPSPVTRAPVSHSTTMIDLAWNRSRARFQAIDLPIFLGRGNDAHFAVLDPRVSRLHARLDRRGDLFLLTDISSYGTWVRFASSPAVVSLRRQECVLLDRGEIALGASFDDPSAPLVRFDLTHRPN